MLYHAACLASEKSTESHKRNEKGLKRNFFMQMKLNNFYRTPDMFLISSLLFLSKVSTQGIFNSSHKWQMRASIIVRFVSEISHLRKDMWKSREQKKNEKIRGNRNNNYSDWTSSISAEKREKTRQKLKNFCIWQWFPFISSFRDYFHKTSHFECWGFVRSCHFPLHMLIIRQFLNGRQSFMQNSE